MKSFLRFFLLLFFLFIPHFVFAENVQYCMWQGHKIAYSVQGHGPALVLVPSVDLGSSMREWDEAEAYLNHHYRVYRFDFLGFGQSEKPDITYTASFLEDQLRAFLREIVHEKAIVVASQLGAAYAVKVANDPSQPISNLVLVTPLGVTRMAHPPGPLGHLFFRLLKVSWMGRLVQRFSISRDCMRLRFQDQFASDIDLENYLDLSSAWVKEPSASFAIRSVLSGYFNEDIHRTLRHLKVPTLVIVGETGFGEHRFVQHFKKLNHTLRMRLVRSSRRWPHFERPGIFCEYVFQFLDRNSSSNTR